MSPTAQRLHGSALRAPGPLSGEGAALGGFPLWASEPGPFLCPPQTERFEVAALAGPHPSAAPPPLRPHLGSGRALCMEMGPWHPLGPLCKFIPGEAQPWGRSRGIRLRGPRAEVCRVSRSSLFHD